MFSEKKEDASGIIRREAKDSFSVYITYWEFNSYLEREHKARMKIGWKKKIGFEISRDHKIYTKEYIQEIFSSYHEEFQWEIWEP